MYVDMEHRLSPKTVRLPNKRAYSPDAVLTVNLNSSSPEAVEGMIDTSGAFDGEAIELCNGVGMDWGRSRYERNWRLSLNEYPGISALWKEVVCEL
jgi:hypothetical protein